MSIAIVGGVGPVAGRTRMLGMWWWKKELGLPPGYVVENDTDVLVLHRPDGSMVAAFSAMGVDSVEIVAAAWEDAE